MDTKWLEDFLSLAETQSFTRSAELRFTTQSAFSRRIKALENWAGTQLFDRRLHRITLTEAGKAFREDVEDILRRLQGARDTAQRQSSLQQSIVSVTATHSLANTFFPPWLKRLNQRLGLLNARLLLCTFNDGLAAITERSCEFMLSYCRKDWLPEPDPAEYMSRLVGLDALLPLCAPDESGAPLHQPAADPNAPFLAYGPKSRLGQAVRHLVASRPEIQLQTPPSFVSSYANVLKSMALQGYGFAWLLNNEASTELQNGELVRAAPPTWDIPLEIRLFRPVTPISRLGEQVWSTACELALAD